MTSILSRTRNSSFSSDNAPLPSPDAERGAAQSERSRSAAEVLFNGVTGFMGLPGVQSALYDPYAPNADQGLGFRQDGMDHARAVTVGAACTLTFGRVTGADANSTFRSSQTATIPVTLLLNGVGVSGQTVTWSVAAANNSANEAVTRANRRRKTGLAWGGTAKTQSSTTDETIPGRNVSVTDAFGNASIQLTDIVGRRTVRVKASVCVGGRICERERDVIFGEGPLSELRIMMRGNGARDDKGHGIAPASRANAAAVHGGTDDSSVADAGGSGQDDVPACGRPAPASGGGGRPDAYLAAGWPVPYYSTGEAYGTDLAFIVSVRGGGDGYFAYVGVGKPFVFRRQPR